MARHDFALCGRSKPPSSADGSAVKECTRAQPSERVVGCGGQVSGHRQRRGRHRGARALTCQGTSHGDEVRSEAGRVRSVRTNLGRRRVGNRAPASDSQPLPQRAHRAYPVRTPEGVSDRCLSRSASGSNRYYDIRYSPWAPFRAVTAGPLQHPIGAGGRHGPLAAARSDGSRPLISTPRPAYVVSGSPRPEIEHG